MLGMVQSLNLSVSVGIILYEALKQRQAKGFYKQRRLSPQEFEAIRKKWLGLITGDTIRIYLFFEK